MRMTLDSLGPAHTLRIASSASRTPLSRASSRDLTPCAVPPGSVVPSDPFVAAEGAEHHRSPARLAQRIGELERDCARQANIRAELADENARLRAVCRMLAGVLRAELERPNGESTSTRGSS